MSILTLVYISDATQDFSQAELQSLLKVCRSNNEKIGITGMMVYAGGKFLQILEGEPEVINTLMEKLEKDQRHANIVVMNSDLLAHRHFDQWSMGFKVASAQSVANELAGYIDVYDGDKLEIKTQKIRSMNINILIKAFERIVSTKNEVSV